MRVFLDTMIYVHYQCLDQMDLTHLVGSPSYTVVMPRITLRELDKIKNTHKSARIKDRARNVLKKIDDWLKGAEIRSGVLAEYLPMPKVDYEAFGLNPEWSDDILIATVLDFKNNHSSEEVVLITQDSSPRMTATHLGINVLELPEEWKLPEEPDPVEVENRRLRKENVALQNLLPKLVVSFTSGTGTEQYKQFILPPPPESIEPEIIQKLSELKIKHPKQHPPESSARSPDLQSSQFRLLLAGLDLIEPIAPEEYARYNKEVDSYIQEYERYLQGTWAVKASNNRTIRFNVEVRNIGTCPAEDVDIYIHFPNGFQIFTKNELPQLPKEPPQPQKPRTKMQILEDRMHCVPRFELPISKQSTIRELKSFTIKHTQSYEVKDHFSKIKHGELITLPEMFITFDSYETASSFNCSYVVRPANLPEALEGVLHFVIKKE